MPKVTKSDITLRLSRVFKAPREKVFRAFTDPEHIRQWWPPEGFTLPTAELDLRDGGAFRIGMKPPEGDVFYAAGTYREVKAPEKLVFTWRWENTTDMDPGETLVTVEFHEEGTTTELVLTHEQFVSDKERELHESGWKGCLDRMVGMV